MAICCLLVIMLVGIVNRTDACTAFTLQTAEGIYVGKNLDWPIGDGFIVINKRGVDKFSLTKTTLKSVQWTSKYGSITFNQFGREFPLGGMNEAGLVVEELSYSPSRYPAPDSLPVINESQWIQYQLDNYRTVEEVIGNLSNLRISKFLFGLHYFLCDRSGNSAVIEFVDGKTLIYSDEELEVPVLSNNSYENSLKYLRLFQGFGGDQPVIKRDGSQERFVRAAYYVKNYRPDDHLSGLDYAFQILNNVRQEDTQWQIIWQPISGKTSFYVKDKKEMNTLRIKDFDYSNFLFVKIDSINGRNRETDIPSNFQPLGYKNNSELVNSVFRKFLQLDIIEPAQAEEREAEMVSYWLKLDQMNPSDIRSQ
jgi:choloylglycine hydrolase